MRWGSYVALCRPRPIPRFRCRACGRTFSSQTFSISFGLHKPSVTSSLLKLLVSGVSIRQSVRIGHVRRRAVEGRLDRYGTFCAQAAENLLRGFKPRGHFQTDEIETYEHNRLSKPLTVGLLVAVPSGMILAGEVGRIRSRAGKSAASKKRRAAFEAEEGRRPNESGLVMRRCLSRLEGAEGVVLASDRKPLYASLVRRLFAPGEVEHRIYSGKGTKGPRSPLFWVNHEAAMARYGISRLIRRSWCVSKKGERLEKHVAIWMLMNNVWRWRVNGEGRTPAMTEGLLGRRIRVEEIAEGYRQDWGELSRRLGAA
ncbi:MAG TPA: hypothetical protein VFI25_15140 [Planctomycetota bacterium]|nr:hypothetical protein [Planctomycetota bacterium]